MAKPLYLIGCSAGKLSQRSRAQDLYQGCLFRSARELVKREGARWYILSAKYGLLHPCTWVEPYNLSLADLNPEARGAWRGRVAERLAESGLPLEGQRVIIFAGRLYYAGLASWLRSIGADVELPLAHLGIGQQRAWFSAALAERGAA